MYPVTLRGMRVVGESVFSGGVAILAWAAYSLGIAWHGRQSPEPNAAEPARVELDRAAQPRRRETVLV